MKKVSTEAAEYYFHPRERNGALPGVHTEVCVKKCLTPPTLLEMAIFQQLVDLMPHSTNRR
jgi:hypothetical protein